MKEKISEQKKTRLFSFHIHIDLFDGAKTQAMAERRSISSVINQALDEFLERKKGAKQ
jgi:hypothetical protein